ncbi:unnamed protein product [Blepharisma stoltei]|uniref:Uncharacterized protein n=1 Tax=Blepharisma stoltei TaxID=1481888 RepID=A0AAU9K5K5_9CILI|nr:unnamed protein product [Blepharisma stoltei]
MNQYYGKQLKLLKIDESLHSRLIAITTAAKLTVLERLGSMGLVFPKSSSRLSPIIKKQSNKLEAIEEKHREHSLKEFRHQKETLKHKLEYVEDSISLFKESPKIVKVPSTADKKEEEKLKQEKAAEFAKKLQEEQINRMKRLKEREQKIIKKWESEENKKQLELMVLEQKILEEKEKRLRDLQLRGELRREQLKRAKSEMRGVRNSDVLYKKIEKKFEENVIIPELERRKEELAKKRELFSPKRNEEKDGIHKESSEQLNTIKEKVLESSLKTYRLHRIPEVIIQDKEELKKFEKEAEEKRILIEKRKKYGEMIKEYHAPEIDPFKKKEMELIRLRLNFPSQKRGFLKSVVHRSHSVKNFQKQAMSDSGSPSKFQPSHRLREINSSDQKQRAIPKDYLKEQRAIREQFQNSHKQAQSFSIDSSEPETYHSVYQKVKMLESKALETEKILQNSKFSNRISVRELNAEKELNEIILQSIKSKLSLLM